MFEPMKAHLILLEIAVVLLGLGVLMADLGLPREKKRFTGYFAAGMLAVFAILTFVFAPSEPVVGFGGSYVVDAMALFFKRFFLVAAIFVLMISASQTDELPVGISEFHALTLFALAGMLFAASSNDFVMMFVSLELITVTFYVLTSFQRNRIRSLEAGVKYLIIGAVSTAFTVYGIALVYGMAKTTQFSLLRELPAEVLAKPLFLIGVFMILLGLSFKIASFPFQLWPPDVYQGSPTPAAVFLAVGSKAAGFVLLLRIFAGALPSVTANWAVLLVVLASVTILYGNLCAIPQRNLKRLLGYSSIANAGYLLLGLAAANAAGTSAILFYLSGYLFSVVAAFAVISVVARGAGDEDLSVLNGLHTRSPLLAFALALSMISLAGIPPLAGFFGKFLLIKSVVERGLSEPHFLALLLVAVFGVVVSFYYYLGVVRAIYWTRGEQGGAPIAVATPVKAVLLACVAGMIALGIFPGLLMNAANHAASVFKF